MFVAGITIAIIGTIGIFAAVGLEIKKKEPIYALMMKIFPWVIGVGMLLMGLSWAMD